MSAAPEEHYTHWKQTVFYLSEVLTVFEGEELEVRVTACSLTHDVTENLDVPLRCAQGVLTCSPNAKNHRDLDISLTYSFDGRSCTVKGSQFFRLR